MHELLASGHSTRSVARQLGMTLNTILCFSQATTPEDLSSGQWQSHRTKLDTYEPYLDQRWQEGCTNAWMLWEEIKEQGYPDDYGNVRAYASSTLRGKPQPVGPRPPSACTVTRWILAHPDALPERDRLQLHLYGNLLPQWIEAATVTGLPSLHRFAQHLERDLDAVIAGLSQPWNSGVVEGPCQPDQDAQAPDVRPRRIRTSIPSTRGREVVTSCRGASPDDRRTPLRPLSWLTASRLNNGVVAR
ncbi:hypothetical protein ABT150_33020 [Streptomyces mirabilis]|uniref:hypothetical protein n=1 Tax=Streptomyces mirabilis TaxID=68239 RepID=UPI00331A8AC1